MRSVTVILDEAEYARLLEAAPIARTRSASLEDTARALVARGLDEAAARARALAALEELRRLQAPISNEEAEARAGASVRAMRAERHVAGRP